MKNNTKNIRKGITAILFAAMMVMAVLVGAAVAIETIDASSVSSCSCIVPEGFKAEVFAVELGGIEDFTFDSSGNLFVGGGHTGEIKEIEFDDDTPLPIDASIIDPVIVGLYAVFGLPFDESGDMFVSEFDNGEITKIDFPLPEPLPFDAGAVSPLAHLTCPDGMAFAPPGSAFGTELFVGDIQARGIFKVSSVGTVTPFVILDCGIEEVIFSNSGDLLFAISPGSGKIYSISPDGSADVIANGFDFPDAIAQGPGNAFGEYLYVGDLQSTTLFRVDLETGTKSIFATFGSKFGGFEDIIFDSEGNMFVLGVGRGGQIIKISPGPTVSISTDSFEYAPGDTMTITLDVANPTEESVMFQWYWGVPLFSVWLPVMSVPIPAGYEDTVDLSFTIPNWGLTPFGNVFYVHLLDAGGEVLDADCACWAYMQLLGAGGEVLDADCERWCKCWVNIQLRDAGGEAMPAVDIEEEIKKNIERVELP